MNDERGKGDHSDVRVVVNARPYSLDSKHITYERVVAIAYPEPADPASTFSVTYRNAEHRERGSLVAGGSVEAKKEGTTFDVVHTGKS